MCDYIELTFVRLECNVSSLFPNPLFQQTNHEKKIVLNKVVLNKVV